MLIFIDRVGDNQPEEKKSSYRKSGNDYIYNNV